MMRTVAFLSALLICSACYALPPFENAWYDTYVENTSSPRQENLKRAVARVQRCNVCHVRGEEKDKRNIYGQAVAKLLTESDIDDRRKIGRALREVGRQKVGIQDLQGKDFVWKDIFWSGWVPSDAELAIEAIAAQR